MKRAELLPVSVSGLCDLSQTWLADYLATLSVRDVAMLQACVQRAATSKELRAAASYSGRMKNFRMWLERLLQEELLEMTVPDKPRSPLQKYRLTDKGRAALVSLKSGNTQT